MTDKVRLPNGWIPRPYQLPAWSYLAKGGKHCELVWHRRSGKDDLSLHWTAVSCFKRPGNYWHMLPQANQARRAIWQAVNPHTGKRRIDEAFPEGIRTSINDHEMSITMSSGSIWQVVGSDNFNSLVGSPPIGLVFSEWALCNPASWAYLMPIIEENGGWVIFNTTPRGKNHAFLSMLDARKNKSKFSQVLKAEDTGIFKGAQLEGIRASLCATYGEEYGLSVFEQEYECSFEAANLGAILGRGLVKAEQDGRIGDFDYDPLGADIEISSDIGRRDASSWFFWQPCVGGFRIVDFDKDSGMDADEWCDRLVLRRCSFHREKTEKGRDGLASWSYVYDEERKEFSKEPDHNWASHDGDSFSYGCIVMEEREENKEVKKNPRILSVGQVPIGYDGATLNDMWREHERKIRHTARI